MESSEWELSKENVQPIKQGRKVGNLTAALTPCSLSVGADDPLYWKLQKDKQNFEAEIRTYEGDDFLDVWYRYILWTEENVPKGGREIDILLERCIKEFQDVGKYDHDERYLNVWLKYANCCADPLEIFNYLYTKDTCSRVALLYIAWASACENVENFQKADQVLMLGIERQAQPLEMLQKHHIGFQHRLTAHIAASEENQSRPNQENPRKALASLVTCSKKMVGVLRASSFQNPQLRPVKPEKKGLGFSILHDSDDSENRISRLPEGHGSEWKEAPTESIMCKENVTMPGRWTGDKAHSRRHLNNTVPLVRSAPKQSFQVHVDENAEQIGHVPQAVGHQVLSVRKTEMEGFSNPLKVISNSAANSGTSNVKVMFDKSKVYAGAEEFQFEEIRAAKYIALLKQGLPLPKDVNRMKREENQTVQPEEKERVMYRKNKVYAYEGEFQPEELMARLYYERGNRLRITKAKKSQSLLSSKIPVAGRSYSNNLSNTSSDISVFDCGVEIHQAHSDAENMTVGSLATKTLPSHKTEGFHLIDDAENIPPPECSSRDVTIPRNIPGIPPLGAVHMIQDDAENIPPPHFKNGSLNMSNSAGVIPVPGKGQNIHLSDDAENIPPSPDNIRNMTLNIQAGSTFLPSNAQNIHLFNDAENIPPPVNNRSITVPNHDGGIPPPTNVRNTHSSDDAENIPPPHRNTCGITGPRGIAPLSDVQSIGVPDVQRPDLGKDFASPGTGPQLRKSFLCDTLEKKDHLEKGVVTPKIAHFKPDLTGPSPTLTTKQAFADVMPWFNTTVGLSTSDDELESDFRNDENDNENDEMGWCGIPFGEGFGLKRKIDSEMKENGNYCNEDQENLPPFGYSQAKVERPLLGVLQPSIGIPFKPLEELETNEKDKDDIDKIVNDICSNLTTVSEIAMKQDVKPLTDDEITLNHSQFTAAARMASTPFEGNLSPPKLENLHCSSIQAHDNRQEVSHENHDSAYNANNSKGLSPIIECSNEDAKTGSSKGSISSHSSGMLIKSHAPTTQSIIVNQTEVSFVQDKTCQQTQLQNRSMDITVHDINGSILKKINPFDAELCNQLLAQLPQPVSSFSGYRDVKENVLPKFISNKSVLIGDDFFKLGSVAGTGAFAKVYSATKVDSPLVNNTPVALKVQRPANDWEFYICFELQKRLKDRGKSDSEIASMISMTDYYVFADGSCSITEYYERGTFLDFVNSCDIQTSVMEETAMYYAIEMMKIIECIHDCGIIHADIKPDNFVLLKNSGKERLCRLGLIDFGCAIDVELFPPGTRFSVDKNTESFECIEMKTQRPWTTQVDTYGMLCSLHCLIFGDYMNVYEDRKTGRWKTTKSFNRTWNKILWNKLFDMFLNIPSCDELPSLANIRQEFQEYFENVVGYAN